MQIGLLNLSGVVWCVEEGVEEEKGGETFKVGDG